MAKGKTIGVVAIKGGVGKTTVSLNLGAVLAKEYDKNVLVVDGNFSTPHVGVSLGLANNSGGVHDVLRNKASVFKSVYRHPSGFYFLPGNLNPSKVNPLLLKKKLEPMKKYFDYIVIDSSPSLNDEMYATISASDELLVVTSPDHPTLSSTLHAVNLAKSKSTPIKGLVVNKSRGKKYEVSLKDIEKAAGVPVLSVLSDDDRVMKALASSIPSTLHSKGSRLSSEYRHLITALTGEDHPNPPFVHKARTFLNKKISFTRKGERR